MKIDDKFKIELMEKAKSARENAYVKYSGFKVGAAVLGDNGKIYKGANVENASYGLTICAERLAVFKAINDGVKQIKAIALIADTKNPVSPCGACRQVLAEFSDKHTLIIMGNITGEIIEKNMEEILPMGFDLNDL